MENSMIRIENGVVRIPHSAEIWMTQHQLADLFQCFVGKINANVRAILKTGVLDNGKVCRNYHYKNGDFVEQYNPEMVITLSYRIQSRNAEVFRKYIVEKCVRNEDTVRFILPLHIMDINNLN